MILPDRRDELIAIAERAWPEVRDSRNPKRLARFEGHFAGTWYAEEARDLRETIEAEAVSAKWQAEEQKLRAEEERFRAEGRVAVQVGDRTSTTTRWLKPGGGEPFRDLAGGPEMVVVPAGRFEMGSPEDEPERYGDESPRHRVTIARPFAVGRHAVTRGQFAAFVAAAGHAAEGAFIWTGSEGKFDAKASWRKPGFRQDDDLPVVCVDWDDATACAKWLAELTGQPYRLLTEAEWEYTARAGTTTPFWWGSAITPAQANYDGNFVYKGGGKKGEFRKGTLPVGSFAANPWGLYNVHGNVWEWCEDVWHDTYEGAPADGAARTTGDSSRRVVRGGSWYSDPRGLRAAARCWDADRVNYFGFRLGRTLTP